MSHWRILADDPPPQGSGSGFTQYETEGFCNTGLFPQAVPPENCASVCLNSPTCQGYTILNGACLITTSDCCSGIIASLPGAVTFSRDSVCLD